MILAAVRAAAKAVILPRFRRLDADEITIKPNYEDLVTVADTEAEVMIRLILAAGAGVGRRGCRGTDLLLASSEAVWAQVALQYQGLGRFAFNLKQNSPQELGEF